MFSVAEQSSARPRLEGKKECVACRQNAQIFFCPPPVFVKRKVEYLPFRTLGKGGMTRGKGKPLQAEKK